MLYHKAVLTSARSTYDSWVENQAKRLGVEPAAILQSVRDFGLTAEDIRKLDDKSGLTRYPGFIRGLKILDYQPIRHVIRLPARKEFTMRKANNFKAKKVKPKHKRKSVSGNPWKSDRGETSLGQALRRVGFK